jgi:hypothetical protein
MSDTYKLMCFVEGDNNPFIVKASSSESISELKDIIKEMKNNLLRGFDASSLTLMQQVCYIMTLM